MNNLTRFSREPFRLFFLSGIVVGILSVGSWLFYNLGWMSGISPLMHARLQIQGFLGLFVIGFLLTALPRLMEVRPCSTGEMVVMGWLFLVNFVAHWMRKHLWGDVAFIAILLSLGLFILARFFDRKDLPPPFFGFVFMGFVHALSGTLLGITSQLGWTGAGTILLGQNMLYQGFLLCLILGIGSFLAPRIMGTVRRPDAGFTESRTPPPGWWRQFSLNVGMAVLIYLSFWMEYLGRDFMGPALRAAIATWVIGDRMSIHKPVLASGFLPKAMRTAMFLVMTGLWILPFFPAHRVAALHVLFIGGYGLLAFVVATRVTLGHSGFEHLFHTRMAHFLSITLLFMASLLMRLIADFNGEWYFTNLAVGAGFWIIGVALWLSHYLGKLLFPRGIEEDAC